MGTKTSQRIGFMGIQDARRLERLMLDVFKKDGEPTEPTGYSKLPGAFDQT